MLAEGDEPRCQRFVKREPCLDIRPPATTSYHCLGNVFGHVIAYNRPRDRSREPAMITNERQYRITKSWLERFEQARIGAEKQAPNLHPRARQALRDQYDSQIEELCAELADCATG